MPPYRPDRGRDATVSDAVALSAAVASAYLNGMGAASSIAGASTTTPPGKTFYSSYAIFEGGGAKGIAHVGALRALEEERQAIIGVAGASAGAIIAALVAVGYRSDELFSSADKNILTLVGRKSPVDLLGRRDWARMGRLRGGLKLAVAMLLVGMLLFAGAALYATLPDARAFIPLAVSVVLIGIALLLAIRAAWPLLDGWGLLRSDNIRAAVNDALRLKLGEHYTRHGITDPVPPTVLFEHIDAARRLGCIPLKIVATNVTTGELTVFDRRYPQVPVADVVAASAALPLVFRPARIPTFVKPEGAVFADGGLVSNLPAWVFRDEKRDREREETRRGGSAHIPVYAVTLSQTGADSGSLRVPEAGEAFSMASAFRYLRAVVSAGIFGSQATVQNFVTDLRVIGLRTALGTLDFDCGGKRATAAVDEAYKQARSMLRWERFRDELTDRALRDVLDVAGRAIDVRRRTTARPALRVALIDPICRSSESEVVGFRVVAGVGMDDDADDTLELYHDGRIAPAAFHQNKAIFGMIANRSAADLMMTKYERAALPPGLCSVIAVPVYARADEPTLPRRVLALDSDDDLSGEFADAGFMAALSTAAAQLSRVLIEDTIRKASV